MVVIVGIRAGATASRVLVLVGALASGVMPGEVVAVVIDEDTFVVGDAVDLLWVGLAVIQALQAETVRSVIRVT